MNLSINFLIGLFIGRSLYLYIRNLFMRRKGSIIAKYIEYEYKTKKAYERKKRVNCKDKPCEKCQYEEICEDKEENVWRLQ